MGSNKEHKRKKEKHKHKRKHKHSDSDDHSPVEPKRRKSEKEHKPKKHKRHKHEGNDEKKRHKSPTPEESNGKHAVVIEEEEVYVPHEVIKDQITANEMQESSPKQEGKKEESLSIEETNRLREKLGLKPLDVGNTSSNKEGEKADFVHAPAEDLWKKKKETELREKLQARKDKRNIDKKYSKVKTLGDGSDDESASNWVERSRQKEKVIKREKELSSVADEFGVGDLIKKEFNEKPKDYTEKDLKGLNVEHSLESFVEGQNAILVIKDKDILASDDEDVLHSVSVQDKEKSKKNLEIKRRGVGYKAYEEEEVDELGFFKPKTVLGKYDEEIEGEATNRFTIGDRGRIDTSWEKQKESMKQEIRAKGESLTLPPLRLASEYLTADELKFKKRKRKVKKTRKREVVKADDLLPLPGETGGGVDHGSRARASIREPEGKSVNDVEQDAILDDDDATDELQRALEKSRKAKLKKTNATEDDGALKVVQHLESLSQVELEKPDQQFSTTISLNATDEFCRQLGAQVVSKETKAPAPDAIAEVDMELEDSDEPGTTTQWSSVVPGEEPVEQSANQEAEDYATIEAEPLATAGLIGALKLAQRKGYLSQEKVKKGSSTVITNKNSHLQAKHYSIEDKNAVDYLDKYAHEKYTKDRGRHHDRGGVITDFAEKKDYKPKVAIEYVDDRGRVLSAKEAFRKLSHRFHGKGSGKMKQEKRMKKLQEEETMKHMSSTDTPLNTVAMMKSKLKTESSPYIVLSGAGKTLMSGGDSLSKK